MNKPLNPFSNLLARARRGESITVAFLGGSITWGGNSSDIESRSYRALTGQWFREQFPDNKVVCINGGFGGTTSWQGAYRVEEQVLSHRPDLLFTEFSINDSTTPQSTIMAAHEAIFRKAWRKSPTTGIILLISGSRDDKQTELITKRIARDFGLHCVDVGAVCRRLIQSGKATPDELWPDVVHPTDHGHAVYAREVIRVLSRLKREARPRTLTYRVPRQFLYWRAAEYLRARLVPAVRCETTGKGWEHTDDHHRRFDGVYPDVHTWPDRTTWPFPYRRGLMVTRRAGDTLSYTGRFRRAGVALDFVRGRCVCDISIDGRYVHTIDHTQKAGRFPRMPEFPVLLDDGRHTLKIVLRRGTLKIGYVMAS